MAKPPSPFLDLLPRIGSFEFVISSSIVGYFHMNSKYRLLLVAFVALLACPALGKINVGDKPKLNFKAFDSHKTIDLADYHGKIIVVDFWATWCGPCMGEAGHMVATNEKYASKGMQFIGVSLDEDPAALKKIIAEKNFTWPQLYEGQAWNGATPKAWGVNSIPQTFIISPEGEVLWRGHPAEIDPVLEKAFKEHPPQLVDAKVLEQANKSLDQAQAALDANKPAVAVNLLATVPDAARVDPAVGTRSSEMTSKLIDFGNSQLTETDALVADGKYVQARQRLMDLMSAFTGTPVATSAKLKLTELAANPKAKAQLELEKTNKQASDALAVANQLKADKKDDLAYPRFKTLAKQYPNTAAGGAGVQQPSSHMNPTKRSWRAT